MNYKLSTRLHKIAKMPMCIFHFHSYNVEVNSEMKKSRIQWQIHLKNNNGYNKRTQKTRYTRKPELTIQTREWTLETQGLKYTRGKLDNKTHLGRPSWGTNHKNNYKTNRRNRLKKSKQNREHVRTPSSVPFFIFRSSIRSSRSCARSRSSLPIARWLTHIQT